MTVRVDYTQIDRPRIRLTLARSAGGWYSVTDQDGRLFFPPSEPSICIRFMRRFAELHNAELDEASIAAAGEFSTLVDNVVPIRRGA